MLDGRHAAATRGELGHGMGDGPTAVPYWLRPVLQYTRSSWMAGAWPSLPGKRDDRPRRQRTEAGSFGRRRCSAQAQGEERGEIDMWGPHVRFKFE